MQRKNYILYYFIAKKSGLLLIENLVDSNQYICLKMDESEFL